MIDHFLAFEESCSRSSGFSFEAPGVFQIAEKDRTRFYTYVVKE
jgi:ornithine decarboxylase